jgi:hypothetical protein
MGGPVDLNIGIKTGVDGVFTVAIGVRHCLVLVRKLGPFF